MRTTHPAIPTRLPTRVPTRLSDLGSHKTGGTSDGYPWLVLGLAAAIAALMVHGLVDTVFYRPQIQFQFWLIVAGLVVGISTAKEERLNETKINAS
ncbi:MAG: hypothetical protein IPM23_17970 [Candidatus Melainabacteria bacterium]|nr:hypothetical protein [Candidatus Melainabacteria bacterium]